MEIQANPIVPTPLLIVLGAALVAFSHWTYRPGTPARRRLLALRWLTVGLAILASLRPNLVFTKKHKQSSTLVVLADKSKSMLLRDMWDNQSRWDALVRLWRESASALTELEAEVRVEQLHFAKEVDTALAPDQTPEGDQTALGDALEEVLRRAAGERLAGIVLLSDGTNTTGVSPQAVARDLATQQVPVHAFGFGRETAGEMVRDVAARAILASSTTFVKNKLVARGEFLAAGFTQQPINVRLLFDGVEQSRGVLKVTGQSGGGIVELAGVPETVGEVKVTLEADVQPGELLGTNNAASTFVTVRSGGIRVVEIEGKYRYWEPKFLRWALDQSPDIELNQLFLLDTAGKNAPAPPDLFAPGGFDVFILGDVPSNRFTTEQLAQLADRVLKGAGLVMIGGYESFGPGGWGRTPLAEVLPITMREADGQRKDPLKLTPTPAGLRHFILRLTGEESSNQALWKELRPLDGGSQFGGLKPNALLLATAAEGDPALVAEDVGAGRSIAFAGDTTWRWRKDEKGIAAHARFWRQLILWLAHRDEVGAQELVVRVPYRRLALGQKLPLEVEVLGAGGKPVPNAQVQASVRAPDGTDFPVPLAPVGEQYRASFWQTDAVGDYTLTVAATADGQTIGSRTLKFLVHAEDREMLQLAADLSALRNLATATGGEYHPPEELPKFIRSLKERDLNLEVAQSVRESLWDRASVLALFVALLAAEWILRKRNGLA